MAKRVPSSRIAALSVVVKSGTDMQLLPAGEFRARDGRPNKLTSWVCNATIAAAVIAFADARQTPFVIDYEHQTLLAEKNGQPAPAAGWFKALEWRDGDGLYATDVEWTAKAKAMIDAGEYRFISPVFSFDPDTGAVLQIMHAALTNVPALDGMSEVVAAATRFFSEGPAEGGAKPSQEQSMNELLKKLLGAIGLQETATEAEALGAVAALKAKADQVSGLETQVAALKTASPDPEKFVPVGTMKELQDQVAALSGRLNGQELDGVIAEALTAGKLLPAQEAWARDLGAKNLASLKSYLASAISVVPTGSQSGGKKPDGGNADQLNAEQLAVCKQMGITQEAFLATLKGESA